MCYGRRKLAGLWVIIYIHSNSAQGTQNAFSPIKMPAAHYFTVMDLVMKHHNGGIFPPFLHYNQM